jgi:hypothetical protein
MKANANASKIFGAAEKKPQSSIRTLSKSEQMKVTGGDGGSSTDPVNTSTTTQFRDAQSGLPTGK